MKTIPTILLAVAFASIVISMQSRLLTKKDLQIKGALLGATEEEVSLLPGYPIGNGRFQNGYYRKFKDAYVYFNSTRTVTAVHLTGRSYSTYRGLRVGDRSSMAMKLYGSPADRTNSNAGELDKYWTYFYSADTSLGIMLSFVDLPSEKLSDTIRSIVVGKLSLD
jgi:hypothetical protein